MHRDSKMIFSRFPLAFGPSREASDRVRKMGYSKKLYRSNLDQLSN